MYLSACKNQYNTLTIWLNAKLLFDLKFGIDIIKIIGLKWSNNKAEQIMISPLLYDIIVKPESKPTQLMT